MNAHCRESESRSVQFSPGIALDNVIYSFLNINFIFFPFEKETTTTRVYMVWHYYLALFSAATIVNFCTCHQEKNLSNFSTPSVQNAFIIIVIIFLFCFFCLLLFLIFVLCNNGKTESDRQLSVTQWQNNFFFSLIVLLSFTQCTLGIIFGVLYL